MDPDDGDRERIEKMIANQELIVEMVKESNQEGGASDQEVRNQEQILEGLKANLEE